MTKLSSNQKESVFDEMGKPERHYLTKQSRLFGNGTRKSTFLSNRSFKPTTFILLSFWINYEQQNRFSDWAACSWGFCFILLLVPTQGKKAFISQPAFNFHFCPLELLFFWHTARKALCPWTLTESWQLVTLTYIGDYSISSIYYMKSISQAEK